MASFSFPQRPHAGPFLRMPGGKGETSSYSATKMRFGDLGSLEFDHANDVESQTAPTSYSCWSHGIVPLNIHQPESPEIAHIICNIRRLLQFLDLEFGHRVIVVLIILIISISSPVPPVPLTVPSPSVLFSARINRTTAGRSALPKSLRLAPSLSCSNLGS